MPGRLENLLNVVIERLLGIKKSSTFILCIIFFSIVGSGIYYYYRTLVDDHKSRLMQIADIKNQNLLTLFNTTSLMIMNNHHKTLLDWFRVKKYFYGFSGLDVNYIYNRNNGMVYFFHYEDNDLNPVNKIKFVD